MKTNKIFFSGPMQSFSPCWPWHLMRVALTQKALLVTWWGLLWPNSPASSQRQILASGVGKSPGSRRPQDSALPREWDAASQLFYGIFQLSEAAASWPTCLAVLQESQGNSSSHYISESCLSNTPHGFASFRIKWRDGIIARFRQGSERG